jgi:hypothetical protein
MQTEFTDNRPDGRPGFKWEESVKKVVAQIPFKIFCLVGKSQICHSFEGM